VCNVINNLFIRLNLNFYLVFNFDIDLLLLMYEFPLSNVISGRNRDVIHVFLQILRLLCDACFQISIFIAHWRGILNNLTSSNSYQRKIIEMLAQPDFSTILRTKNNSLCKFSSLKSVFFVLIHI